MTRELIFIHGRAQQGKDALALKQEWIAHWRDGLAKGGLDLPLPEDRIRFPFFGDTLAQMVEGLGPEEAARVIVRGDGMDRDQEAFMRGYLQEVQAHAGISDEEVADMLDPQVRERGPLNWGWVQGILSVLDRNLPGASGAGVALFTRDVYQYLTQPGIRQALDDGVKSAFTPGRQSVVVSHSLGTVVAYNVLRAADPAAGGLEVPLFVTLGSPLAVTVVKKAVRPIGHPRCAARWFNAMDERDVVALFPLTSEHFDVDPSVENKTDVDNPTENRHGISGYLGDAEVARKIFEAVTG